MKHSELEIKDYLVSDEIFGLKSHPDYPGLLQTAPFPMGDLSRYYESENYISHEDKAKGLMNRIYYLVKNYNLNKKYEKLQNSVKGEKILDYGCGTGEFVKFLLDKKMNAFGYEPTPKAFEIAMKKAPSQFFNVREEVLSQQYNAITLWHVLEHIPNLFDEIQAIRNALSPDGKLFIAVPNYESYDARYYREYWAAYDVPRHLWHFNQNAMHEIFNHFGMIIENIYPMYFDAFYVSMLSEKYKGSSLGFLKGMLRGLTSNLKAIQNGQFSSLIYQIRSKN